MMWEDDYGRTRPHLCAHEGVCRHQYAKGPWLPFTPLRTWMGQMTLRTLAGCLGLSRKTVEGWHARDEIPYLWTDRCACAVGLHPAVVWGNDWYAVGQRLLEDMAEEAV